MLFRLSNYLIMIWCFTSLSKSLKSYRDESKVLMKGLWAVLDSNQRSLDPKSGAPTTRSPGPSCSKLTMLVNDSLKFTSSDTQICWNFFAEKMWVQKLLTFFFSKNIRILYIESAKTVNEMTLNELVKLTTLWTTGSRLLLSDKSNSELCCGIAIFVLTAHVVHYWFKGEGYI